MIGVADTEAKRIALTVLGGVPVNAWDVATFDADTAVESGGVAMNPVAGSPAADEYTIMSPSDVYETAPVFGLPEATRNGCAMHRLICDIKIAVETSG